MQARGAWGGMVAGLCLAFSGSACGKARPLGPPPATGPQITITGASVNGTSQVVASYTITQNGSGVTGSSASSLSPQWTLAGLSTDPVSGLPAWQSYVLAGSETLAQLPIDGPGTPAPFVLQNVKQPGSESGGAVKDLGGGSFTYTFQSALPSGLDPAQTLRVGVWLAGAPGTPRTASTFDFTPSGAAAKSRDLVLDANCNRCHGLLQAHGGFRSGVKLCLTCHTYQNADADTVDPAAMTGATPATNPNPLDMGRLVHRIHRGRNLPTLYVANPTVPNATRANVSLPFNPTRNAPLPGRKYSIVGYQQAESTFGQVVNRTDNGQPALAVATGVRFPQDLRNCDACHGGAAQASEHLDDISRRTCQGCHADTWFEDPSLITDQVHFMHPGYAQPDDTLCASCHIGAGVDADITTLHMAPVNSPSYDGLTAAIASVQNLKPGQSPTVVFTLSDRNGTPSPLGSPTPATDPASPVPRALGRVAITISGPTTDYHTGNFASTATAPITETVPLASAANASGQFSYTFASTVPASATGTWAVALEARRSALTPFYDATTDTFFWPYTGETLAETADNPVQYVDVAAGSAPGGNPIPRRQVVSREACNACHMQLGAHGDLRHNTEYCVMCHAPDATDWSRRPKDASGNTSLASTYDDVEERSVHFKVLLHRIHTGGRMGSAELDLARPFAVYGYPGGSTSVGFFDDVRFPNDLANCALCHVGASYTVESVPPGAMPTLANETASIQHAGTPAHGSGEPASPPIQAACMGCHDTGAALVHARQNTTTAGEQCVLCHGANGYMPVSVVHDLQPAQQ